MFVADEWNHPTLATLRCASVGHRERSSFLDEVDEGVDDLGSEVVGKFCCEAFRVFELSLQVIARVIDGDNSESCPLPEIRHLNFCYGNVEFLPDFVLQ